MPITATEMAAALAPKDAKFPKGVPMTVEEVAAIVGPEFQEMNENPPPEVVEVRQQMEESAKTACRQRLTWKQAVKEPSGLYGHTRQIQADCEGCIRKLTKTAQKIAKATLQKDERTADFLRMHTKRGSSLPARVILLAMKDTLPKIAAESAAESHRTVEAGGREYGLYGFPTKTARLGLNACSDLREAAGLFASELHARRAEQHAKITSFLDAHCKEAKCNYARLLLSSYPDVGARTSKTANVPQTVAEWLSWES